LWQGPASPKIFGVCGRYQLLLTWERLVELYGAQALLPQAPSESRVYNIAPTQPVAVVVQADSGIRGLTAMRWGFPALWLERQGKDPFSKALINAKAEDAPQKRTWSGPLKRRRCIVPATGFYEWLRRGKARFPLLFEPIHGELLSMAGIWNTFVRDGDEVGCVALLTTRANATMAPVHDRMPVLLAQEHWSDWLAPEPDAALLAELMGPASDDLLEASEVSTALNSWRGERPDVLVADWTRAGLEEGP